MAPGAAASQLAVKKFCCCKTVCVCTVTVLLRGHILKLVVGKIKETQMTSISLQSASGRQQEIPGPLAADGWCCPHCLGILFEKEEKTDRSGEWAQALGQWTMYAGPFLLEIAIATTTGIIGALGQLAWIIVHWTDGAAQDWHIYQTELSERDGLNMRTRDAITSLHREKLARRVKLLQEKDCLIAALSTCEPIEKHLLEARIIGIRRVLQEIEFELQDYESTLRIHKMV
jgi:hypothetical protein